MPSIKKLLAGGVLFLFLVMPFGTFAREMTPELRTSLQAQITQLLQMVQQLQAQLALIQNRNDAKDVSTVSVVSSTKSANTFNESAAFNFIKSMYVPSVGLVKECPECSNYWLWSDNLLAQMVLRHNTPSLATPVKAKMDSYGIPMRTMWATLDPQYVDHASFLGTQELAVPNTSNIRYGENAIGGELGCSDYADIAFLKAIYKFNTGDVSGARQCYDLGKAMWDGTGMKDTGNITGDYAVYKVALGRIAEQLTGFPKIGIPANYFDQFQAANGGITTDIVNGQPSGSQNVETTAAVLIAKDVALLDKAKQPATKTTTVTTTPSSVTKVYGAANDLRHNFGRADSDGWSAATALDEKGTMLYGPYATDWSGSSATATFRMMVDNNSADDLPVATIDIYDSTAGEIIAIKDITRKTFIGTFQYQDFPISASIAGRAGHAMEVRVYWHDVSYVRVAQVSITLTGGSATSSGSANPGSAGKPGRPTTSYHEAQ
jgi:hypothetical protein